MSKGIFLVEGKSNSGPHVWARMLSSYLQSQNIIDTVNSYKLSEFLKLCFTFYKYSFIHFYSQTPQALILMIIFKLSGKKVYFTVHGDIPLEKNAQSKNSLFIYKGLKRFLWIPGHKIIFAFANTLTFPSKYNLDRNKSILPQNKPLLVITNPYTVANVVENNAHLKTDTINLGIVTSFNHLLKQQGVDFLAKVLEVLNSPNKNRFILHIIGPGAALPMYKEKYENRKDMIFHGYKNTEERDTIMKDCYICPYVSFQDNMPYAILETINMGIPVLSINTGAIGEMLPSEFVLKNPNPEEFAESIKKFIDTEYYNMAQKKQFEFFAKTFDIKIVGKKFITELYSQEVVS